MKTPLLFFVFALLTRELCAQDSLDLGDLSSPLGYAQSYKTHGKFNASFLNPVANKGLYATSFSKELNCGIYSEDMAYALINEQQVDFSKYLDVVAKMYAESGVPFLDAGSGKRIRSNKENTDSIYSILSERYFITDQFLEEKSRKEVTLMVNIGANIEALYLFCKDAETNKSQGLAKKLAAEKPLLEQYETLLAKSPADGNYDVLLKEILNLSSLLPSKITDEEKKFSNAVITLRKKMVK